MGRFFLSKSKKTTGEEHSKTGITLRNERNNNSPLSTKMSCLTGDKQRKFLPLSSMWEDYCTFMLTEAPKY